MLHKKTMWGDPEQRQEKKLFRIGRRAAYAVGAGVGAWFLKYLYPRPEEADHIAAMLGPLGWVLIIYAVIIMAFIILKKELAPMIDMIMMWLVVPALLFYIFMNNPPGG
ncbi:MAG: hypothetical protein IT558_00435 [Alphaproteobacteria bacterium]|nr:hypothetical protein [Alphaproteobacteria bacterium]